MVKITACVITKNEEENIISWIKSMKRITNDLVVVDTGSDDDTVKIAKENGAKVYAFQWKENFADAKNFAITKATGEWIIFLDADEYFSESSSRNVIRYIETYHLKKTADALVCKIINIDANDNNRFINEFYNLRIFKNIPELRYIRPVHEMLSRTNGSLQTYIISDGVEIYHTGYSNHIIEKKLKRNLNIILAEIAEKGEQRQHYRYLCECYHGLKQFDLSEKYARLHIEKGERSLGRDNSIHKRLIECMMLTRQDENKIILEIDKFIKEFPDDPEFFWYKGELLFSKHAYYEAKQELLKFVKIGECQQNKVDYGQSTLYSKLCAAYYPLGLIAEYRGDKEQAIAYYKMSLKKYKYNNVTLPQLLKILANNTKIEIVGVLNEIYTNSVTDIKFIVKNLEKVSFSPVYQYYHEYLQKISMDNEDKNEINKYIATRQYDFAASQLFAEISKYYEVLLIIMVLDPAIIEEKTLKTILPKTWQKVYQKLQGQVIELKSKEQIIFEKILEQLPDSNKESLLQKIKVNHGVKELEQNPDELYKMAAKLYFDGKNDEAEIFVKKALLNKTKYDAEAYKLLGFIYYKRKEYVKIIDAFEKALICTNGLNNDFSASLSQGLGRIYLLLGDIERAKKNYLHAFEWCSDTKEKLENYSSYLLCCHYNLNIKDQDLFIEHCKYQELLPKPKYIHSYKENNRQIRVGYISADFREHVMANFYYAFLNAYDKNNFYVVCYSIGEEDKLTENLKKLPNLWRNLAGKSYEEIAAIIHADKIDILVDLGGHSANSGLPVLAYKPAPIQLSGLGYFNTTGLQTVDYFITDIHLAADKVSDNFFVERLLKLPHSHFCYKQLKKIPMSKHAPCLNNRYVTFGCFNQYPKITNEMLAIWNDILKQVENSIIVLKCNTFICEDAKTLAKKRLKEIGFDVDRVYLEPPTIDYMNRYLDIDIALDTYPYQGGGTTCDALYMGVPVITMAGTRHGARFGYSILKNIGLDELAVNNKKEYIERTVGLASDTELLDLLHRQLRIMMEQSPLMNETMYMNDIETMYKQIIEEL